MSLETDGVSPNNIDESSYRGASASEALCSDTSYLLSSSSYSNMGTHPRKHMFIFLRQPMMPRYADNPIHYCTLNTYREDGRTVP